LPNPQACGNAWFVKEYVTVPTANAELHALGDLNPRDTAVVQAAAATALQNLDIQWDSTNSIRLTAYHPDKMEYEYTAKTDQVAVFSEIYYPASKGWKCYLNGQPAPDFFKVNYLLRGMRLPAGQNQKLEMRFEPKSYLTGGQVGYVASILTLLLFGFGLFTWYRKGTLRDPNQLNDMEGEAVVPRKGTPPPAAPTKTTKKK
jgi:hypothetical protein